MLISHWFHCGIFINLDNVFWWYLYPFYPFLSLSSPLILFPSMWSSSCALCFPLSPFRGPGEFHLGCLGAWHLTSSHTTKKKCLFLSQQAHAHFTGLMKVITVALCSRMQWLCPARKVTFYTTSPSSDFLIISTLSFELSLGEGDGDV